MGRGLVEFDLVRTGPGGGTPESCFMAGYYGFNANIFVHGSSNQNISAHQTYLCFGPFCQFFGDFWVQGINSFSQRISEIYRNRKFATFDDVLKLEFEVKNWRSPVGYANRIIYSNILLFNLKKRTKIHLRIDQDPSVHKHTSETIS